ncbi:divergent polysaccharide deacetylase family protein [Phenylobacterium sp.]|uniref:divergent polysaccharide deacetylase family protein n=1 Tax=Phenylobacterium sp. TaxID=1871053 RepID=UPI0028966E84|nr:divergent polysaccharide deacetylase family protein [Phenylobacterium sp.]
MFSKKHLAPAIAMPAPAPPLSEAALRAFANPYVGASAAGGLFLVVLLALIALIGDPKASSPVVRLSLAKIGGEAAPDGWREAMARATGQPIVTEDIFRLSETPIGADAAFGEATITMEGGGAFHAADPLPQAPLAGFHSQGPSGLLPIIAANGRTPAEAYARPFAANGRPKVALVIGGLGLNAAATRQAIDALPPEITLSFVPYAEGLQGWIDLARAAGHEVLLETPMEPSDYPDNDPGPYTLLADAPGSETVKKLEWVLSRATGYFGVTNYLGSRFMASDAGMSAFQTALRGRGLAFIDDGQAARRGGSMRASATRIIDEQLSGEAIDQQLLAVEAGALQHGQALGSGFAYPVTLSQVAKWAESVESRGYQLAPASALISRR